ncbi:MAG: hypothetical protein CMO80_24295 [Verrucomicrobiales bacterium]|nr:hypothetical protein [Verrucomicrobiales bacterium]|tara:strand:+ start:253 stop:1053 length:801 start_codon:yes stop_codon:yes gene_type:complete
MNENDICEAHRKGWNETAAIHERAALGDLLEAVRSPDFCTFDEVEKRIFGGIDLAGKDVVQLACNNARELISVKRAGAGRCVGFDISDAFVDQAHRLIEAAQLDVEVLRSNVYNIPAEYDNGFDLAYLTVGTIGWLPDLSRFLAKVAELLRPGGQLFIYELHPFVFVYDEETTDPIDPRITRSYFRDEPLIFHGGQDYVDPESSVESTGYWHHHTFGQIMTSLIEAGIILESFEEFPHCNSSTHAEFAKQPNRLPLCYALVARKQM